MLGNSKQKNKDIHEVSKPLDPSTKLQQEEEKEPDIIEKVIYIDRREARIPRLKRYIRTLGCLPLCFCFFLLTYITITKSDPYWGQLVTFMNAGVDPDESIEPIVYDDARKSFERQIENIGSNYITLDDSEATALARNNLSELPNVTVRTKPNVLQLQWIVDESSEGNPLYGRIDYRIDYKTNEPYISYVGFNRFGLPSSVSKQISIALLPVLEFKYGTKNPKELLSFILTGNESNAIQSIYFGANEITFEIQVTLTVFE